MKIRTMFFSFAASVAIAFAALFSNVALAQDTSPEGLVKKITEEVLEAVKQDPSLRSGDKRKALQLAEEKVLPYIDFEEATKLAVGRAWNEASPDQRKNLVNEFRSMLVRIYSNAIDAYRGQTMEVQRAKMNGTEEASVRNLYKKPGAQPVAVEYAMRKTPQGWKVYDVNVEGISLVATYRLQFAQALRDGGIDGLIKRMSQLNATPAVAAKS